MIKKLFGWKKIILYLMIIMCTYFITDLYTAKFVNPVGAVAYYYGSRGDTVMEIQRRLKAWGYYNGNVDGIYGYRTYTAVKYFQSTNGLKVDGVSGNSTLQALGINTGAGSGNAGSSYNANNPDLMLLARLINGEARGEPYEGQVAVGAVVLNRTRDAKFPRTVAGVIYQPGAFTATVDGQIEANLEQSSINAARDALNGWDPSGGAIYYFNPATATSSWIWSRPLIKIIGKHRFCR